MEYNSNYTQSNGKIRCFTNELNFKECEYSMPIPDDWKSMIPKIKELDVDGVIIRNFITDEETNVLLNRLEHLQENRRFSYDKSRTFPASFASLEKSTNNLNESPLIDYFHRAKQFRDDFKEQFDVDMESKFNNLFARLNNGNAASVLYIPPSGSYLPFTFRVIAPQKNHINIHCGNQFVHLAPDFYAYMLTKGTVFNQLSFFVVIQEPELGGELSVYNVTYDVAKIQSIERQTVILDTGKELDPEKPMELHRTKFKLNKGDMILFGAGQLWHRVEEVYGNKHRITLGGFLGYSHHNNEVFYWS